MGLGILSTNSLEFFATNSFDQRAAARERSGRVAREADGGGAAEDGGERAGPAARTGEEVRRGQ